MADLRFEELPNLIGVLISKVEDLEKTLKQTMFSTTKQSDASDDKWFTLDELREYLPEHPARATIYAWVHSRTIPHHKGSKCLRFRKSEIDEWIVKGKRKSESELNEVAQEYLTKNKGGKRYE